MFDKLFSLSLRATAMISGAFSLSSNHVSPERDSLLGGQGLDHHARGRSSGAYFAGPTVFYGRDRAECSRRGQDYLPKICAAPVEDFALALPRRCAASLRLAATEPLFFSGSPTRCHRPKLKHDLFSCMAWLKPYQPGSEPSRFDPYPV